MPEATLAGWRFSTLADASGTWGRQERCALLGQWSPAEKAVAPRAYDEALAAAKAIIVAEVKARAAAAATIDDIWEI